LQAAISEKIRSLGRPGTMMKVRCPICNQEMPGRSNDWPDYPLCSPRCRKIDLGRWLGEQYRIPTAQPSAEEADAQAAAPDDQNP
jgi:endogenous inhibitor of DNA gyrase (YacG/DUF329 family)